MEQDLELLPRRGKTTEPTWKNKTKLTTNIYDISLRNISTIYQYSLDSEPELAKDSIQVLRLMIKAAQEELKKTIGFLVSKGNMLWGSKSIDKPFVFKSQF
jgi:hypothetical protein